LMPASIACHCFCFFCCGRIIIRYINKNMGTIRSSGRLLPPPAICASTNAALLVTTLIPTLIPCPPLGRKTPPPIGAQAHPAIGRRPDKNMSPRTAQTVSGRCLPLAQTVKRKPGCRSPGTGFEILCPHIQPQPNCRLLPLRRSPPVKARTRRLRRFLRVHPRWIPKERLLKIRYARPGACQGVPHYDATGAGTTGEARVLFSLLIKPIQVDYFILIAAGVC
jgi:hypothetical protein